LEKKRMQDDQDVVREFLVESHENLSRLDQDLIELELRPKDTALLASVFRTIHTIKGTCGFFAFSTLEKISHQAETLLSQLRDGKRELNPSLVSLILETVDATRKVLASIEASGEEGPDLYEDLTERLRVEAQRLDGNESPSGPQKLPDPAPALHKGGGSSDLPVGTKVEEDITRSSAIADANIRVAVVHLDKLMDLVGELVLTRNQILQFNAEREDPALNATAQRLNLITTELQEGVMKTRMQPIGMVWNKLPRVVRDMAVALGKQIRLEMDGADTELDRTIIEAIKDPLVHLIRNSCDHGIEPPDVRTSAGKSPQGKLTLRAYHEGGQVNIEIGDDGIGIDVAKVKQKAVEKGLVRPEQAEKLSDREALNLIFQPGFSTAQMVTKVSGRGVGLDVVKSNIEKIGGVVDICNRPGEGATVKLKIPLTLAIIPGLVITSGGERFVIPQVSLLELIRLEGDSSEKHIEQVHGTPVYRRRGSLLPIAYLNRVLGLQSADRAEAVSIVVLQAEDRQFGLMVDGINDTQEIVVKPLGKQLKGLTEYAGATIMGDGRVALILDVLGIGQRSGVLAESREPARAATEKRRMRATSSSGCSCSAPDPSSASPCPFRSSPDSRSFPAARLSSRADAGSCSIATAFSPWCFCAAYWNPRHPARTRRPIRCRSLFSTMVTLAWEWWSIRFWMWLKSTSWRVRNRLAKDCWARRWSASASRICWTSTRSFTLPTKAGSRARAGREAARRSLSLRARRFLVA
jgi:two-component system, chemotaxis family, sensor kinase CheA